MLHNRKLLSMFMLVGIAPFFWSAGVEIENQSAQASPILPSEISPLHFYGFDYGFVDYISLDLVGNSIDGHFSPILSAACDKTSPVTRLRNRSDLRLPRIVDCPAGSSVLSVHVVEIGRNAGPGSYIRLDRGLTADCGAFANLDVTNTHPSRPIGFTLSWQRPSDGAIIDYPYYFSAGQTQRDLFRCGWGTTWVSAARF